MDVGFDLGTILEEFTGVAQFEFEVVVTHVGAEADFLNDRLDGVGLEFLLALLLLVEELLVVDDLDHGGLRVRADLHEVQLGGARPLLDFTGIVYFPGLEVFVDGAGQLLDVIAYEANIRYPDHIVDPVLGSSILPLVSASTAAAFSSTQVLK